MPKPVVEVTTTFYLKVRTYPNKDWGEVWVCSRQGLEDRGHIHGVMPLEMAEQLARDTGLELVREEWGPNGDVVKTPV